MRFINVEARVRHYSKSKAQTVCCASCGAPQRPSRRLNIARMGSQGSQRSRSCSTPRNGSWSTSARSSVPTVRQISMRMNYARCMISVVRLLHNSCPIFLCVEPRLYRLKKRATYKLRSSALGQRSCGRGCMLITIEYENLQCMCAYMSVHVCFDVLVCQFTLSGVSSHTWSSGRLRQLRQCIANYHGCE